MFYKFIIISILLFIFLASILLAPISTIDGLGVNIATEAIGLIIAIAIIETLILIKKAQSEKFFRKNGIQKCKTICNRIITSIRIMTKTPFPITIQEIISDESGNSIHNKIILFAERNLTENLDIKLTSLTLDNWEGFNQDIIYVGELIEKTFARYKEQLSDVQIEKLDAVSIKTEHIRIIPNTFPEIFSENHETRNAGLSLLSQNIKELINSVIKLSQTLK